jgi:hypothetical protein
MEDNTTLNQDGQATETTGQEDIMEAIRKINAGEFDEFDDEDEVPEDEDKEPEESDEEPEDDEPSDDDLDVDEDEEPSTEDTEPAKKVQSKEENARFARERRERETQARIDAEIEKVRSESPEFQLAKQLSELYGTTPDVIMAQIKEQQLQDQAKAQNVPVEVLKRQQESDERATKLEKELNQVRFQLWNNNIGLEKDRLASEFPMLSSEDMDSAVDYILNVARNVDLPLKQAVYAVHGEKIINGLKQQTEQEILAKESGRSKRSRSIQSGKPSKVESLTDEERYVAKQLGMTEEDYLKYK